MTKNGRPRGLYFTIPTGIDAKRRHGPRHLIGNAMNKEEDAGPSARGVSCRPDHRQQKKRRNEGEKDLIFAMTGGIFMTDSGNIIKETAQGISLKQNRNSDWLLIGKRQNSMKESRQKNARREIWRILSAYFFGYWRTSDQNAFRMSPFFM